MGAGQSTLVQRICAPSVTQVKIPIHALIAALQEVRAGRLTAQQIATFLNLTAQEQTDGGVVLSRLAAGTYTLDTVRNWFLLGEAQGYTVAQVQSLLLIP